MDSPRASTPATPIFILRGHTSPIHALKFLRSNLRLLSGDSQGWVVLWNVATRRSVAVWKAHDGGILGLGTWPTVVGGDDTDRIISHGRDGHIRVWHVPLSAESSLSAQLPAKDSTTPRKSPWLLHSLKVNTINFCAFAACPAPSPSTPPRPSSPVRPSTAPAPPFIAPQADNIQNPILLAVPSQTDSHTTLYHLPLQSPHALVPPALTPPSKPGMLMALRIFHHPPHRLQLLTGFESGHTALQCEAPDPTGVGRWETLYVVKAHSQPILSLDGVLGMPLPPKAHADVRVLDVERHSVVREPEHQPPTERGAVSVPVPTPAPTPMVTFFSSSADALLVRHTVAAPLPPPPPSLLDIHCEAQRSPEQQPPPQVLETGHAGQQSLTLRSDGRILATAGWDGRVRVYGARKKLREVAVLKWHKVGCYAVAFGEVGRSVGEGGDGGREAERMESGGVIGEGGEDVEPKVVARREPAQGMTTQRRREEKTMESHWLAAGSKDGTISLWTVY